ncbi:S8 family serine peptidase [Bacillus toyonensis]|uniref:S8 family peptidase n=1 Tax=Bacillus toyonensis TaxID=155322 RepID=UPI0021CF627D|nr:S8 family serine peptidase [Bacillus toyonensis]MCU4771490.1 S8 family serine peptidase [Bacillus toyonensis]MCU5581165.1 S8 family serine peptidase [Bacillus toyonensis]
MNIFKKVFGNKGIKLFVSLILCFFFLIPVKSTAAIEQENYYTVLLKNNNNYIDIIDLVKEKNIEIVYSIEELGIIQIKTDKITMQELGENPLIDTYNFSLRTIGTQIETDKKTYINSASSLWDKQWDMKKITNNGKSYDVFSGSKNVVVGIIDSGLDMNHPDLKNNIVTGSKNLVPKGGFRGKEKEENGDINNSIDKLGHGTYVSGQIAANGKIKGVAPNVGIKSYRVFGERTAESLWIIKGIIEAAKDDVDVINISLGDYLIDGMAFLENQPTKNDIAEIKAFKEAIEFAEKQGSVVVAAAGNNSLDVNNKKQMYQFLQKKLRNDGITLQGNLIDVPASLPGVVTVSSIGPSNNLASFSNFGKDFIDIAAPGGDNRLFQRYGFETWSDQKMYEKEQVISTGLEQDYIYDAGNSVAAPKISGALALIIDKKKFKNQPEQSVNYLYNHGVDYVPHAESLMGKGVLNVFKLLQE